MNQQQQAYVYALRKMKHLKCIANDPVKVGDIFCMSWGYDQTNVDYFQVTRLSKAGVFVREIGSKAVPGTQGFMCQDVKPAVDNFLERSSWCKSGNVETFRRIDYYKGTPGFNFKGRYFARRVDKDSKTYNSWYA